MIDHIVGRPNPSWKRAQVFLVIAFWIHRIVRGNSGPPRILFLPRINKTLRQFTPWQIVLSTLTAVYAIRNFDHILGLGAPEPLARLYSPDYYRATWITTGLDAGFATAMAIRPKWFRDICSILFSLYYIIYANEADEKLRRFRAVPTVEMLRTTWEKTTNPYLRLITHEPHLSVRQVLTLPRPSASTYTRPITAYLFFAPPAEQLSCATDLILDFPGGGFVAMNPEHHEERLRLWATHTGRPVLSIDYGKAPEYPYPFAIDEAFDTYKILIETAGRSIGMSGKSLKIIMTGDSAGATIAVNVIIKILESNVAHQKHNNTILPMPVSVVLSYAALDFNFTSWMTPNNLRVLRSEHSSGNLPGLKELAAQKDHLQHVSPLSMVPDKRTKRRHGLKRKASWRETLRSLTSGQTEFSTSSEDLVTQRLQMRRSTGALARPSALHHQSRARSFYGYKDEKGSMVESGSEEEDVYRWKEEDRPIQARIRFNYPETSPPPGHQSHRRASGISDAEPLREDSGEVETFVRNEPEHGKHQKTIGTRLTMTSRTGYFQDRIVSPSMMRAMAILYIGPHRNPDFSTDYYISPILTPAQLLAQFPPLLMQCGEKDPFVDDTVIFAGRVREAKRARKVELDLALSGKSARFGENLWSNSSGLLSPALLVGMKRERDRLASESEDDWVKMVLFSDWSHGYLQMPSLMPEAKGVIVELAEWINGTFKRHRESSAGRMVNFADVVCRPTKVAHSIATSQGKCSNSIDLLDSETETDEAGITFAPKRQHNRIHLEGPAMVGDCGDRNTLLATAPGSFNEAYSGSDTTLIEKESRAMSPGKNDGRPSELPEIAVHASMPEMTKPTGQRQSGQTISETELMRRRRLLDSHIFE